MKIPISRTSLTDEEIYSVLEPLRSGWLVQGPRVSEFEQKWSDFTGAAHSVAVTSGTTALHLSLAALGFGPGDEAIVPAFTWVATANVVEHLSGTVVFCDIDLSTFNLDVSQLESKITSRTRVILPVHLFGLSADMDAILEIAGRHGLHVIEDAACGFGTVYRGRHVGMFGNAGCFSFHPRKAITTGEGGMITTNDGRIAERLRRLRDHGAETSDLQRAQGPRPYLLADHSDPGFNYRMTDFQGALGSAQMDRASSIVSARRALASRYDAGLADLVWLRTPPAPEGFGHSYQSYACLFQPEEFSPDGIAEVYECRNRWMDRLQARGIATRPATHAVHMLSFYRNKYGLDARQFPNAFAADRCTIALPLFHGMSEEEQDYVIQAVREGWR